MYRECKRTKEIVRLVQQMDVGEASRRARSRLIRATGALFDSTLGRNVADGQERDPALGLLEKTRV